MDEITLKALFDAKASSAKLLKHVEGTWRRYGTNDTDYEVTIPHEYANDNIFVTGVVKVVNSDYPTEQYYFSLPYVDAMGGNVVTATWDSTNVYIEFPWNGSIMEAPGVYTDYDYSILIMLV